ncbi:hypothetical protein FGG08_000224 [Glutinoglossum americanum]|uniref:Sister chromatid cohesion protein n=1 Tax=Glutinoglossum americanum TaxID=1670608 RepID=A0A9P8I9R5_9PEZI|nr:hypothetical protein FGG08_000224 [Glutinoglossum americanum]
MNGVKPKNDAVRAHLQPLNVEEALKYTPLSSVIPFSPDIVPLPSIGIPGSASIFASSRERNQSRQSLEALNQEAKNNNSSTLVQDAFRDLHGLINPWDLTEYFKLPSGLRLDGLSNTEPNKTNSKNQLGAFSELLFNSTDAHYRYPTPSTPGSRSVKSQAYLDQPRTPSNSRHIAANSQKHSQTKSPDGQANGLLTPQKQPPLTPNLKPLVVVPELPPSSQPTDYESFPDVDAKVQQLEVSPLKKRKSSEVENDSEPLAMGADQRAKATASLKYLQELISCIFEAEDSLQPDSSGTVSGHASKFFVFGNTGEGEQPMLVASVQSKLESSIQKVTSVGRFADVPADDLSRLQKVCEGTLRTAESVDLKIGESWDDSDIQNWLQRIGIADCGLRAARTLLRVMTGGRSEKQFYSEDTLQSILLVLKNVLDSCIIPVVESRSTSSNPEIFKVAVSQKKLLVGLFQDTTKILRLLAQLLVKEEVTEGVVTTVEFLAAALIFIENAHSEKDSVVGIQKFERLRVAAMDVLAKIFSRYEDQRTFIFDEILTSLEKLPVTRQSARQFKLIDGKNIQLVSALILRLVQASATRLSDESTRRRTRPSLLDEDTNGHTDDSGDERQVVSSRNELHMNDTEIVAGRNPANAVQQLYEVSQPLLDSCQKNAHYVIQFLVSRALKSTKTGDAPYRNLLDIFAEDFINVLGSPDWPAAELLLRSLLTSMVSIAEADNSAAIAKNMALDLMGLMGSAISDMMVHIRQISKGLDVKEKGIGGQLARLTEDFLDGRLREEDLLAWDGPYRATLEYLRERDVNDDAQLQSACGFYLTQWCSKLCCSFDAADEGNDDEQANSGFGRLTFRLRQMVLDRKFLETEFTFETVSTAYGRLAYTLTTLNTPFCKAFERVLIILLNSMNSDQATVRSKSLKSVIQLLEKDPTILDRGAYVMRYIINRASDSSPLVRDSALSLIGRCLTLKPALEDQVYESILARSMDAAVGVRKRSMKILKDIYLRNAKKDIKSAIASALLHRVKDSDQGVSDLARQTFEEIWISPFYRPAGASEETAQYKLAITEGVAIIVKTVQRGDSVSPVLDGLLQTILSNDSKNNAANFRVCKSMVAAMFDDILDGQEEPDKPGRQHVLQTLTVFAKANPRLLTPEQLQLLQPYIENLSKNDDLHVYRSVIVIFRCALPYLSGLQTSFLTAVQKALMESVSKLGKRELNEVIFCLWTITGVLKNVDRLLRLTVSCLKGIYAARNTDLTDETQKAGIGRVTRYMTIAGLLGKHCDFENEPKRFRDEFPWWKGNSVSSLMVDIFSSFTSPKQPLAVRKAAIEGLGLICQSHPKNFLKEQVYSAFDIVFAEENRELESLVLTGFKEFLAIEEKRSERGADLQELDGGADIEAGRLSGATTANQNDGVTTSIAQRYLKHITRISLATQDAYALTAVEVIASINRQGLVHPKECGPVLVALETSQHPSIASIAFHEHRALHQKHETLVEREYMKAVEQAFQYQKNVVGDPSGATASPFTSKLRPLFDVIKISKGKIRKKFISGLCSKIDFDPAKLDVTSEPPTHLEYAKFVVENLAFFEYSTVDELLHVIASMERVVAGTGTSVAHAIETEVFKVQLPTMNEDGLQIPVEVAPVDSMRLRQLTTSSMILSILWDARSFIRRLHGLNNPQKQREGKGKQASKALSSAPTKVNGVTGDKLWEEITETMAALTSTDTMMAQCKEFVEMLSVDQDFKLAAEGEEDGYDLSRMKTPDYENEEDGTPPPPGSGRGSKRKAGSETPAKRSRKRARSSGGKARRITMGESDDEFED